MFMMSYRLDEAGIPESKLEPILNGLENIFTFA
jgi:hypothetical protein